MSTSQEEWHDHDGIFFYTRTWTASEPKAHIIFAHGFMEHVARYEAWFSKLADSGIQVFAYDQRGFGRTAQKTSTQGITCLADQLKDLEYYVQRQAGQISSQGSKKLFLMGHSMGGALVLTYVTSNLPGVSKLAGVISSSPLINQADQVKAPSLLIHAGSWIGKALPSLQMNVGVASKDISRDPAVQEEYAADSLCPPTGSYKGVADMLLSGPKLLSEGYKSFPVDLPILLYHGTADKVTSFDSTKEFEKKIEAKDKKFIAFEGYYHEPHNEPGDDKWKVLEEVKQWVLQRS